MANIPAFGDLVVSGSAKVGADTRIASLAEAGAIRLDGSDIQYSDGAYWLPLNPLTQIVGSTLGGVFTFTESTADRVIVTGTAEGFAIAFMDATTLPVGKTILIVSSIFAVVAIQNGANSGIARLEPYQQIFCTLIDNTTGQGVWHINTIAAPPPKVGGFFDDFNASTGVAGTGWLLSTAGTGATATAGGTIAINRNGIVAIATGTTTTGRTTLLRNLFNIIFGTNLIICEAAVLLPILSTAGDEYAFQIGFGDNLGTGILQTDGAWIQYNRAVDGDFWSLNTASNNATTKVVSSIPVTTAWTEFRIEVNRTGTRVNYFINNTFAGFVTTNIPVGALRNTSELIKIIKSAGASNRTAQIDFYDERFYRS